MLNLPFSSNNPERFYLHAEDRVMRGRASIAPKTSGSIELTQPLITPLTSEFTAGDPELAPFLKKEEHNQFLYHHVTFCATFQPEDKARFDTACVAIHLGPNQPPDAVIAWSMYPQLQADSRKISKCAKLHIGFQLVVEAEVEIGADCEIPEQTWFLRRLNEQTATPYWEFKSTEVSAIDGQFCFHLVTQTVANLQPPVFGELSACATINEWRYFIFHRSDTAATPASRRFDLIP